MTAASVLNNFKLLIFNSSISENIKQGLFISILILMFDSILMASKFFDWLENLFLLNTPKALLLPSTTDIEAILFCEIKFRPLD